ncbi:MAG: glutamine synthetase type III [Proteobacteria bacterium]|nr:MAG: glutamine synthetase type III [Pseudomonadota bacterium]
MSNTPQFVDEAIVPVGGDDPSNPEQRRISDVFRENSFSLNNLEEYVTETTYEKIKGVILKQQQMEISTAEHIAEGLIKWALTKGVTHYTHWFQPLTGATAEKHDAFFKPSFDLEVNLEVRAIESLSASQLVRQETDGSSFPSGGLRETHAARSYTIWDPSSPAFILETRNGKTLYIPAVFISYTGEALDYKLPLLKANHALNVAATAVCQYFDKNVQHVFSTLGWEQEYFLVDEAFVNRRPDLLLTGRTLFGGKSARGQQMDDHYFGSIPARVQDFMKEFEVEALKLGIPIVTRHNEVAPSQYECAPMYEETNVSVDHNNLIMHLMREIAIKHKFRVLFEEKPFAGLNGNGKHNNWSMATSNRINLCDPGEDPGSNLLFLTFFINTLKAIHDNADILRASVASEGNDHRLGANEAPPAIISVYIGSFLEQVLAEFKNSGLAPTHKTEIETINLGLSKIAAIKKDQTDRNRTSPFPFTDNRFEFRAVGGAMNCAAPMTALNTMVADQLQAFKQEVESQTADNKNIEAKIITVLQRYMDDVEKIVFDGDGYSEEWEKEARNRGLSNNKTTPVALKAMLSEKSIKLFDRQQVFSEQELRSRYEVFIHNYINKVRIDTDLLQEISNTFVIPAASEHICKISESYRSLKEMGIEDQAKGLVMNVKEIAGLLEELRDCLSRLKKAKGEADGIGDIGRCAEAYADNVKPLLGEVRLAVDALESVVDHKLWQLPKYRELLFIR